MACFVTELKSAIWAREVANQEHRNVKMAPAFVVGLVNVMKGARVALIRQVLVEKMAFAIPMEEKPVPPALTIVVPAPNAR
mmetsp:Transcript_18013/g.37235  ORF Transcript_18013/g.37235 Transcript_18013/m.37235 type:complete len:81 (+) Transcript_18013:2-244(+)